MRRDCELRAIVADAVRCLGDLSAAQRRVLTLRAGLGAGPPRSRAGVAKRLRISERRVVRLERTGLRRLRSLDRSGACAPPARTALAADVAPGGAMTLAAASTRGVNRASGSDAGRAGGAGRSNDGAGGRDKPLDGGRVDVPPVGGVAGASQTNRPSAALGLTLPLILLCLAAVAVVLARTLRREPTVDGAASAEDPRPVWVPWHRSTMRGPGWNDPRPARDRAGEWSGATPAEAPEEWTPPTRRSYTQRR